MSMHDVPEQGGARLPRATGMTLLSGQVPKEDARLIEAIWLAYRASGRVDGANRVVGDLREASEEYGRTLVARRMPGGKIKAVSPLNRGEA